MIGAIETLEEAKGALEEALETPAATEEIAVMGIAPLRATTLDAKDATNSPFLKATFS